MIRLSRRFVLFGALGGAATVSGQKKKKDRKQGEPLGLLSGTAFGPNSMSFPGVEITVYDAASSKTHDKAVTDARGEFAMRVPATADGTEYRVVAEAKGFQQLERNLVVYEGQRTNANFRLKPDRAETATLPDTATSNR